MNYGMTWLMRTRTAKGLALVSLLGAAAVGLPTLVLGGGLAGLKVDPNAGRSNTEAAVDNVAQMKKLEAQGLANNQTITQIRQTEAWKTQKAGLEAQYNAQASSNDGTGAKAVKELRDAVEAAVRANNTLSSDAALSQVIATNPALSGLVGAGATVLPAIAALASIIAGVALAGDDGPGAS